MSVRKDRSPTTRTLPHIGSQRALDRRHFLRGAGGVFLGLPMLEAMVPAFQSRALAAASTGSSPKRFFAACAGLGFHAPYLFPEKEGLDYQQTPYLSKLQDHRDKFTIFSGLSHPQQSGINGHASSMTWLTSAKRPGLAGFRNTISLDQQIAQHVGTQTRYPYLALTSGGSSLAWTSNGVAIPGESSPSRLFKAMFTNGTEREIEAEVERYQTGRSILDTVLGEAKKLGNSLGQRDRDKLDEYLTSVRELEHRLQQSEGWATRPKPSTQATEPKDIQDKHDTISKQRLMYEMATLALQSDSTRAITYAINGFNHAPSNIPGVNTDWHNLSHHGRDEAKINELKLIEEAEFTAFNEFLTRLDSIEENGATLLDRTSVLFGSNLGNASSHNWRNLPIIVAGGGYRHQGYVAHDADDNTPLANLFVQLAQRMGVPTEEFGSSTAASIRGLG